MIDKVYRIEKSDKHGAFDVGYNLRDTSQFMYLALGLSFLASNQIAFYLHLEKEKKKKKL